MLRIEERHNGYVQLVTDMDDRLEVIDSIARKVTPTSAFSRGDYNFNTIYTEGEMKRIVITYPRRENPKIHLYHFSPMRNRERVLQQGLDHKEECRVREKEEVKEKLLRKGVSIEEIERFTEEDWEKEFEEDSEIRARENLDYHLPIQADALFFFKEIPPSLPRGEALFRVRADKIICPCYEANLSLSEEIFDQYILELNEDFTETIEQYQKSIRRLDSRENRYPTEVMCHCNVSPNLIEEVRDIEKEREREKRWRRDKIPQKTLEVFTSFLKGFGLLERVVLQEGEYNLKELNILGKCKALERLGEYELEVLEMLQELRYTKRSPYLMDDMMNFEELRIRIGVKKRKSDIIKEAIEGLMKKGYICEIKYYKNGDDSQEKGYAITNKGMLVSRGVETRHSLS
jgi:hypothetical protein